MTWIELGGVPPADLVAARLELHHAVQLLASFGQTLLTPLPDDSHRSMVWEGADVGFTSGVMAQGSGLKVSLAPTVLTVSVRDQTEIIVSRSLIGVTPDEAYGWLGQELAAVLGRPDLDLGRPEYDMPPRETDAHGPFVGQAEALTELGAWYGNTAALLGSLVARETNATPVRCWPHHFDLATLLVLDPELGPEKGRTVGVGLSPGDEGVAEPYWYVTPYPDPGARDLPELPGGYWNTEGWFGAVLRGSEVVGTGSADGQADLTRAFAREAVIAARSLLSV